MELTPREKDKLMLYTAGLVAERRLARGLHLNYPEAVALISMEIIEGARDGRSVAELMQLGRTVLTNDQVMEGVAEMVDEVQVRQPFLMEQVGYGSRTDTGGNEEMIPGETRIQAGELVLNEGRETVSVVVANTGDRPIQVGSHYHFMRPIPAFNSIERRHEASPKHCRGHSCSF